MGRAARKRYRRRNPSVGPWRRLKSLEGRVAELERMAAGDPSRAVLEGIQGVDYPMTRYKDT